MNQKIITIDGRLEFTDVYATRHYGEKAKRGHQKLVKVDGGYRLMEPEQYRIWRNQK